LENEEFKDGNSEMKDARPWAADVGLNPFFLSCAITNVQNARTTTAVLAKSQELLVNVNNNIFTILTI